MLNAKVRFTNDSAYKRLNQYVYHDQRCTIVMQRDYFKKRRFMFTKKINQPGNYIQ